ncbi:MAG TPA: trimethylamine corrinoid protein 2, partial [Clostridiaceae bacterium]
KNLDMVQWTPVAGQPPTSDFIPVLQKIQCAGKGLVLIPNPEEVEKLMSTLSPKGLQLVVKGVKSEDDARTLVKKVEYWSQQHK